jgi:hypothetical protein
LFLYLSMTFAYSAAPHPRLVCANERRAGDVARQQAVMHRVEKRIGRIERRLELTEEG